MKRLLLPLFLFFLLFTANAQQQSVSIGTTDVNQNAVLWLNSSGKNQGLIIPVVSSTKAVNAGSSGMIVYSLETNKIHYFAQNDWVELGGGSGTGGSAYTLSLIGNELVLSRDGVSQNTLKISNATPGPSSLLAWDDVNNSWTSVQLSGDVSNSNGAITVTGLSGKALPTLPANTQALVYDGTKWVFQPISGGGGTVTQIITGNGLTGGPITTSGTISVNVGTNPNQIPQLDGNGKLLGAVLPTSIDGNATDDITTATAAGGDLSGTYPNPTVAKIQGRNIANTTPANNDVLKWNGTAWAPATDAGGMPALNSAQIFVGNASNVATAVAMSGDATIANTGAVTIVNSAVNSAKIADGTIAAVDLNAMGATNGQVLKYNGTAWAPAADPGGLSSTLNSAQIFVGNGSNVATGVAMSGDATITNAGAVTIANNAVNSAKIADGTVAAVDLNTMGAANGQVLKYNGTAWAPAADGVPTLNSAQIFVGNGSNVATGVAMSGDATISNTGALTVANSAINSVKIADATITGTDLATNITISTSGNITTTGTGTLTIAGATTLSGATTVSTLSGAGNRMVIANAAGALSTQAIPSASTLDALTDVTVSSPSDAQILIKNGAGDFTNQTVSGDVTLSNTGVATIAASAITGTEISNTAGNNIVTAINDATTTGTIAINRLNTSVVLDNENPAGGDINGSFTGGFQIAPTIIMDADINTAANITGTKINPNFGAQNISTTGSISFNNALLVNSIAGTNGQVLTSQGAGTAPIWSTASAGWGLTGNAGTTPATQFIGTTDLQDVVFRTNNVEKMRIEADGDIGIGIAPSNKFQVFANTAGTLSTAIRGSAQAGTNQNFGVYGDATGGAIAYGVYGFASGAGTNWAGYFDGNTAIAGGLSLGSSTDFGTTGQILTSQGPGVTPIWTTSFSTLNYIPRGNGSALVSSSVFDNGSYTAVGRSTAIGSSRFDIEMTVASGSYGGMYVNTTDAASKPFYGYSTNGLQRGWTYYDGGTNYWHLNLGSTDRLTVTNTGNVGIGVTPVNKLDVEGGVAIGSTYAGTNTVPSNGALVQGSVGIGVTSLTSGAKLEISGGDFRMTDTFPFAIFNSSSGTGNAGIKFEGSGTGRGWIYYRASSNEIFFSNTVSGGTDHMTISTSGLVGMSRSATVNILEVEGNASKTAAGSWLANSDKRIKTNITDIDNSFDLLKKLRPVKFHYTPEWKKKHPSLKDHYYYNFIAQEYQQVFPESTNGSGEFIEGDPQEVLQIDTYNAQIVTIKAVQELITKVEALEKENAQLKAEKTSLENELKAELSEIKKALGIEAKASTSATQNK